MMRAALLAVLPACSLYFHDAGGGGPAPDAATPSADAAGISLSRVKAIGGEHHIAGIDSDRAGGIWIAYREPATDYNAPAEVWITHLDASDAKLSEWYFHDEATAIAGIAYDGATLWVSYSADIDGIGHLRGLDPATGATVRTLATTSGFADLSYGDGMFWLSTLDYQVSEISPESGDVERTFSIDSADRTNQYGIAYENGELWLVEGSSPTFQIVDTAGATRAIVPTWGVFEQDPVDLFGVKLAWDGSGLIAASATQIVWIAVRR